MKVEKKKTIDILDGNLLPDIIRFAIPIALSSILQQLFNAADTTVVGQFAGATALAAVGTNSELVALIVTISSGLAVGSNVLIARYIGENKKEKIQEAISSSVFFALVVGMIGLVTGLLFAEMILKTIQAPEAVFAEAVSYLRIYFIGYPCLVMYDFCSAVLRAKGDSKRPFMVLIASGGLNVALNLAFVILLKLGVVGVAVATSLSNLFACLVMLLLLFREKGYFRLSLKKYRISLNCIKNIVTIGLPSAIQGAVFCFANLFITASVNSFGEIATAGSTVSLNYEYFSYYVVTAFCQTATTFTSQNFAAKKMERCKKVLKYCIILGILFTAMITIPMSVFSRAAVSIFTNDQTVMDMAVMRMKTNVLLVPFCAIYEVLAGCLRGRGYSLQPAVTTMLGICAVRIIWIFTVFRHLHTLRSLFVIFPISWGTTIILMIILYWLLSGKELKA